MLYEGPVFALDVAKTTGSVVIHGSGGKFD